MLFKAGLPGAPYPNGGNVNDPVTAANEQTDASATSGKGILIGDWNQNGQTDTGESTLYWSLTEAYRALDASQSETKQDARLILARDMVSTWLNFMASNPVGSVNPADGVNSPKEHLIEAIQWMQLLMPDENGDNIGDGYIKIMGSAVISPVVPSSSSAWNNDVTSQLQIPLVYRSNTGVTLPVEAGSQTHNALDEYNNFGTIGGYVWAQDGDGP